MKNFWKILIASLLPTLRIIGEMKKNEDVNKTGREGLLMEFPSKLIYTELFTASFGT